MPNKRPNILFVLTDQQRPEWVEMNPDIPVRTPHLRQLADRGIWLANAICPSPVCAPSRSCLVAGQEYDRTRVWGNDTYPPDNLPKYHLRLRDEAGYHVMAAGKHHVRAAINLETLRSFTGELTADRDWKNGGFPTPSSTPA